MRTLTMRTGSRVLVIALTVLVSGLILLHSALARPQPAPAPALSLAAGTVLNARPAPAIHLADQSGAMISLDQFRGKVILLTFMDATCTQECPITAQYLDWTAQFLGAHASQVAWLAVTVNPTNTPAQANDFMTKNQVVVPLHLLLGTQAQLAPVWKAYGIQVVPPAEPGGDVAHTIVTYVIDRTGHEREVLDQVYDPKLAAQDMVALLSN